MNSTEEIYRKVHQCIKNCVTCDYRAINGIEWPCVACSQNTDHENAKDMWQG